MYESPAVSVSTTSSHVVPQPVSTRVLHAASPTQWACQPWRLAARRPKIKTAGLVPITPSAPFARMRVTTESMLVTASSCAATGSLSTTWTPMRLSSRSIAGMPLASDGTLM